MKNLFTALVKAQSEISAAVKDSTNPHFKSKYADLSSVVSAIKPALSKHGLGFVQVFREATGGVTIETIIIHESGEQFPCGPLFVPASKQDAQGYGSAITYTRRYSLQTAVGLPSEDDDGNGASKDKRPDEQPDPFTHDPVTVGRLKTAKTVDELAQAWKDIPVNLRARYASVKDARKAELEAA
jgi:hypothetical protein